MPIAVSCGCGKSFRVKDELDGKRCKCPECGGTVAIGSARKEQPIKPRTAAVGSAPPRGPTPIIGLDEEIENDRERRLGRRKKVAFEKGWFRNVNAGWAGGLLMIVIAVAWFVGGLAIGRIFFYPPILFVIGVIAVVKGTLSID